LPDDIDMKTTVERKLLADDALAVIRALPEKRRMIWELRYGLTGEPPMKQKEIARRMGCSRARISWVLKEGLQVKKTRSI